MSSGNFLPGAGQAIVQSLPRASQLIASTMLILAKVVRRTLRAAIVRQPTTFLHARTQLTSSLFLVLTHDLKAFDAPFFGFTQQEATSLDPQQRLLLECTFEALESAGVPKHEVVGKNVGVFVGGTFSEYEADLFRDPETIPMHQATGTFLARRTRSNVRN
jgi:3-oxoacyl-(acyl-carrier-protein) synthase